MRRLTGAFRGPKSRGNEHHLARTAISYELPCRMMMPVGQRACDMAEGQKFKSMVVKTPKGRNENKAPKLLVSCCPTCSSVGGGGGVDEVVGLVSVRMLHRAESELGSKTAVRIQAGCLLDPLWATTPALAKNNTTVESDPSSQRTRWNPKVFGFHRKA